MAPQRLLFFWLWMLLLSSLCPWADCKRGGGGRGGGRGKGGSISARAPPSRSKGSSNQGLKVAGAAAAGAVGGAAVGYGLSSMGRPRYGHGHGGYSNDDRRYHYPDGHRPFNQSNWGYNNRGSSTHAAQLILTLVTAALHFIST